MSQTAIHEKLRLAGLRPTRQRLALAGLLFNGGDRHVSAESLHLEALKARAGVSLATVYNTLNQFTEAGLLREVAIEGSRSYFDTNISNHIHFFLEDEERLVDIPVADLDIKGLPQAPSGREISRIDVIIRLAPAKP
jgi:Fur family iron response transcriptional regulator